MPHVDGLELLQRIHESERGEYVYVIMLTAKAEMQNVVSAMGAGADDFLATPVHREDASCPTASRTANHMIESRT